MFKLNEFTYYHSSHNNLFTTIFIQKLASYLSLFKFGFAKKISFGALNYSKVTQTQFFFQNPGLGFKQRIAVLGQFNLSIKVNGLKLKIN